MNFWLVAALVLTAAGLGPCVFVALRGDTTSRLIGLQLGGTVATLDLLLLTQGFSRSSYVDLAMVLSLLSFAGGLVFVRFLERWL